MGIRLKGQTTGYVEIKAPATAADNTLTLPNGNGSSNQVLTTDGSGGLTFAAPQLSTDTTPQLGGNLDVNGNDIVTTSNGDIDLDPNGSGQVVFKGNATRGSGAVKLNCENNSHGILVKGPPHSAGANYTLTLPNDTGTSGQLLSTNGSGVTSWTTVDASPSFQATADGALTDGKPVVVQANGTVKAVGETTTAGALQSGTNLTLSGSAEMIESCYDSTNNKVLVYYKLQSNVAYLVAGEVSSTGITYGTAVQLETNLSNNRPALVHDTTNGRTIVAYQRTTGGLTAKIATITSGTSITLSTSDFTIESGDCYDARGTYDATNDTIIFWFNDTSQRLRVATGYLGGSSASGANWNSVQGFEYISNVSTNFPACLIDPDTGLFVGFWSEPNTPAAKAVCASIGSNRQLSFSSTVTTIASAYHYFTECDYDTVNNKVVVGYRESNYGRARVGTVSTSGTNSITFGTEVTYESASTGYNQLIYDATGKRVIAFYQDGGNSDYATYAEGVVSGTSITFSTPATAYSSAATYYHDAIYAPNAGRMVFSFQVSSNPSSYVYRATAAVTNLTAENYIGISNGAYSDGATATIQIVGSVDDAQSSLTPGQQYYVQGDGTLGLTPADPSVFAGTAVAATKLIVKG